MKRGNRKGISLDAFNEFRRFPLTTILSAHGYKPVRWTSKGAYYVCPFHKETKASFFVSTEVNLSHCHGCHCGGDSLNLVRRLRGCSDRAAALWIARRLGIKPRDLFKGPWVIQYWRQWWHGNQEAQRQWEEWRDLRAQQQEEQPEGEERDGPRSDDFDDIPF